MKLRIKGNSIRLRLTRSEVASVVADGWLENHTDLGNRAFRFALSANESSPGPSAQFHGDGIVVIAPKSSLLDWAMGEEVGLYGEQSVSGGGERLSIAIEKDFRCLDRSRADGEEEDNYPHPAIKPKIS